MNLLLLIAPEFRLAPLHALQGRRKHFFSGQAKNIMESNGALARREIFEFNFIHDYDVIIIGHERSSKVTGMLSLPTSA